MMGKTHMATGAAAGAGLALVCNARPDLAAALIAASVVGSLVPDLDGAQSTGSHLLFKASPLCGLLFFVFLAPKDEGLRSCVIDSVLFAISIASFPILTAIFLPHRGPTHSVLLWLLALLATLLLVPYGLVWALSVGLFAGILVGGIMPDAATHSGVPAFWPLYKERVHILPSGWRVKTGGLIEMLLVRPAILAACLYLLLALLHRSFPALLPVRIPPMKHS